MSSSIIYQYIEYQKPIRDNKYNIIGQEPWKHAYIWREKPYTYFWDSKFQDEISKFNPGVSVCDKTLYKYGHFADSCWGFADILKGYARNFPTDGDPDLNKFLNSSAWNASESFCPKYKISYIDPQTNIEKTIESYQFYQSRIQNNKWDAPQDGELITLGNGEQVPVKVEELPAKYYDSRTSKGYILGYELKAELNKRSHEIKNRISELEAELKYRRGGELMSQIAKKLDIKINKKSLSKTYEWLNDWTCSQIEESINEYKEELNGIQNGFAELRKIQDFIELSGGPEYLDLQNFRIIFFFYD